MRNKGSVRLKIVLFFALVAIMFSGAKQFVQFNERVL